MPPKAETVSLTEIADAFGVEMESIRLWRTKGMPHRMVSGRPRFVIGECIRWRREQDRRETRESTSPDEAAERTRKLAADADFAELRVKQKRGELVPAVDVERHVERLISTVRSRVLAVRSRWAPRVIGLPDMAAATVTLDELALDILSALSDGADDIEVADVEESRESDEVAA